MISQARRGELNGKPASKLWCITSTTAGHGDCSSHLAYVGYGFASVKISALLWTDSHVLPYTSRGAMSSRKSPNGCIQLDTMNSGSRLDFFKPGTTASLYQVLLL